MTDPCLSSGFHFIDLFYHLQQNLSTISSRVYQLLWQTLGEGMKELLYLKCLSKKKVYCLLHGHKLVRKILCSGACLSSFPQIHTSYFWEFTNRIIRTAWRQRSSAVSLWYDVIKSCFYLTLSGWVIVTFDSSGLSWYPNMVSQALLSSCWTFLMWQAYML